MNHVWQRVIIIQCFIEGMNYFWSSPYNIIYLNGFDSMSLNRYRKINCEEIEEEQAGEAALW